MIIYRFKSNCYNCNKEVYYYTYLIFREYEIDVTFPLDMDLVRRIYVQVHSYEENPFFDNTSYSLNFPVKVLGDDELLDKELIEHTKFPNINFTKSKLATKPYAANFCPHCNSFLGNYHLREKVTDLFLRPNIPMEIYCNT